QPMRGLRRAHVVGAADLLALLGRPPRYVLDLPLVRESSRRRMAGEIDHHVRRGQGEEGRYHYPAVDLGISLLDMVAEALAEGDGLAQGLEVLGLHGRAIRGDPREGDAERTRPAPYLFEVGARRRWRGIRIPRASPGRSIEERRGVAHRQRDGMLRGAAAQPLAEIRRHGIPPT